MVVFGALTARSRARKVPHASWPLLVALALAGTTTLAVVVALGVFKAQPRYLVPVGGMVIGNAMTAAAVALNRLGDDVNEASAQIEAALALGATATQAMRPIIRRSLRSGMIPLIDSTKTTGLIFFPGTMVGMLLAGAAPIDAVRLQLILLYTLLGSVSLGALTAGPLAPPHLFPASHPLRQPGARARAPRAPLEGAGQAGDRHVLVLQRGACRLYELYNAQRTARGWEAGSGAMFNLRRNALRPEGWTSADAAGLPILPLLVRYPEVHRGEIRHALRVTVARTQRGYIHPATHFASSSSDPGLPPMGLRLRLKTDFSLAAYHGQALVVLRALKHYGLIVADNGSSWFITGAPDRRWRDEDLDQPNPVPGSAFEAVQTGRIVRR